eukprot:GEMP01041162.1.p1 GENE.GEMP01041162.1~~GEMP01041162.1.p1  ORF type:complete len:310 (+),score=56.54 GEMP01041162.1:344-1273(+)
MDSLPEGLTKLVLNPNVKKVGVNILADLKKLWRDDLVDRFEDPYEHWVDVGKLALRQDDPPPSWSLSALCEHYFKASIEVKTKKLVFSNWERKNLCSQQQSYAATDAALSLCLYRHVASLSHAVRFERECKPVLPMRKVLDDFGFRKDHYDGPISCKLSGQPAIFVPPTAKCARELPPHLHRVWLRVLLKGESEQKVAQELQLRPNTVHAYMVRLIQGGAPYIWSDRFVSQTELELLKNILLTTHHRNTLYPVVSASRLCSNKVCLGLAHLRRLPESDVGAKVRLNANRVRLYPRKKQNAAASVVLEKE